MRDEATSQLGSIGGKSIQATNTTSEANLLQHRAKKVEEDNKRDWAESDLYQHVFQGYLREYMEAHNQASVNMKLMPDDHLKVVDITRNLDTHTPRKPE